VTLTLEPGVIVQFQDTDDALVVDGTLIANGTAANPILFTSDNVPKQAGQWEQIVFHDSSDDVNSVLNHCIIEYAGQFAEGNLTFYSASPRVTNTVVRNSLNDGIYCSGSSPQIGNCLIGNNGRDGVRTCCASSPVITNSAIFGNVGLGVNNLDTTKIIKAEGNYWGHPTGPYDNANTDGLGLTNPGGLGDKVSEYVDWSPFLTSTPTAGDPLVSLAISRTGNQAVLSWPYAATGYSLQCVTNSASPTNAWATVTNLPVLANLRYVVTNSVAGDRKFYRLIR